MTIDVSMRHLPLFGKDYVVLLYGVLDDIGRGQHLLLIFLGVCLDLTDLGSIGSPFHLGIVHLQEIRVSRLSRSLLPLLLPGIQASLSWVGIEAQWRFRAGSLVSLGGDNRLESSSLGPPSREETTRTDR